jgi:hypothetical protein
MIIMIIYAAICSLNNLNLGFNTPNNGMITENDDSCVVYNLDPCQLHGQLTQNVSLCFSFRDIGVRLEHPMDRMRVRRDIPW